MEQYVGDALARPRMYAALVAQFRGDRGDAGCRSACTASSPTSSTQRTREIGIRLALGAARGKVFRDLFGQGARLVLAGLAIGIVAAVGLRGVVSAFLFGVTPGDPVSYVMAAAAFAAVALTAVAFPARRASRVEPISALRHL